MGTPNLEGHSKCFYVHMTTIILTASMFFPSCLNSDLTVLTLNFTGRTRDQERFPPLISSLCHLILPFLVSMLSTGSSKRRPFFFAIIKVPGGRTVYPQLNIFSSTKFLTILSVVCDKRSNISAVFESRKYFFSSYTIESIVWCIFYEHF